MGHFDFPSVSIETGFNQLASNLCDVSEHEVFVRLTGEFDASCSENLHERLKVLFADVTTDVNLDLSGVGFLSASTVGVIVQLAEQLRNGRRGFNIVDPSTATRRVFEACGLSQLLVQNIFDIGGGRIGGGRLPTEALLQNKQMIGQALGSWVDVPRADRVSESTECNVEHPQLDRVVMPDLFTVADIESFSSPSEANPVGCGGA